MADVALDPAAQARLAEHRERAAPYLSRLLTDARHSYLAEPDPRRWPSVAPLLDDPDAALAVVVATAADIERWPWLVAPALVRRRLPYEEADAALLVAHVEAARGLEVVVGRLAVGAIEALAKQGAPGAGALVAALDDAMQAVAHRNGGADWLQLEARVRRARPEPPSLDLSVLGPDDPWADEVRSVLAADFADQGPLLALLAAATATRPTQRWQRDVRALLTARGGALVRELLARVAESDELEWTAEDVLGNAHAGATWVDERSAVVLRGCLWAAPLLADPAVAGDVAEVFERAYDHELVRVANSAAAALGALDGDEAVAGLCGWAIRIADRRFTPAIEAALAAAAARRGTTPDALLEGHVPTFGLAPDGAATVEHGALRATIRVADPRTVTVRFLAADGHEARSAPPDAAPEDVAAVRAHAAAIRKELAAQRLRIEHLLAADRAWTHADWRRAYLEHPLVAPIARRLIWVVDGTPVIPDAPGGYLRADGSTGAPPADEADVRLWHPIGAVPADVARWRALLRTRELVQPFKQAFREVYLLAPAERETGTFSNRFAAHVVRYPQAYALAKARGWRVVALGPYDNDGGRQWRDFPAHGLRAHLALEPVLPDGDEPLALLDSLATTAELRVSTIDAPDVSLPLADVPAVVFSEALRDVDLLVSVSSIATDPTWADTAGGRHLGYWHAASFAELSESAASRRDALAELIPQLAIADRLSLDGRFLVVRGELRTYRIHLGSAGVLMAPDDQYLCIVPARSRAPRLFLPFPEDERLALILSKAQLLAHDDRIADPTIAEQVRPRGSAAG